MLRMFGYWQRIGLRVPQRVKILLKRAVSGSALSPIHSYWKLSLYEYTIGLILRATGKAVIDPLLERLAPKQSLSKNDVCPSREGIFVVRMVLICWNDESLFYTMLSIHSWGPATLRRSGLR